MAWGVAFGGAPRATYPVGTPGQPVDDGLAATAAPSSLAPTGLAKPPRLELLAESVPCDRFAAMRRSTAAWLPCPLGAPCSTDDRPVDGAWLRLPSSPGLGRLAVYAESERADSVCLFGAAGERQRCFGPRDPETRVYSYGHLAVDLSVDLARDADPGGRPAFVCFQGAGLSLAAPRVEDAGELRRRDLAASQWRAVGLGVLLAMGLFTALFFVSLRDVVYLKYQGYIGAFVLYWLFQSGAAARLPGFERLSAWDFERLSPLAAALSGALATLFALEFTSLRTLLPRWSRLVERWSVALLLLVAAGPIVFVRRWDLFPFHVGAINLLMGLGGPLLMGGVLVAVRRGDRYARFYLVGWLPLVVVTSFAVVTAAREPARGPTQFLDAFLVAGAFEAVVLALGLADRMSHTRRELARARELADTDALTGLLNRRALARLAQAGGLAPEVPRFAAVLFDLDRFKAINDTLGHAAGDACLRAFAEHMAAEARRSDLLARTGGEEFTALLPGAALADAESFAERVRLRVRGLGAAHGAERPIAFTVSAGVAQAQAGETIEELVRRADAALYRAKSEGRDRVASDARPERVDSPA